MTITDKQFQAARAVAGEMGFSAVEMSDNEIRAIVEAAEAARERSYTFDDISSASLNAGISNANYKRLSEELASLPPLAPSSAEQAGKAGSPEDLAAWVQRNEDRLHASFVAGMAHSAPAADERARFEHECRTKHPHLNLVRRDGRNGDDTYVNCYVQSAYELWQARAQLAAPARAQAGEAVTYLSTQSTACAGCGKVKHTPLRIDAMGGYVCLTCIDKKLAAPPADARDGEDARRVDWLAENFNNKPQWTDPGCNRYWQPRAMNLIGVDFRAAIDRAMGDGTQGGGA